MSREYALSLGTGSATSGATGGRRLLLIVTAVAVVVLILTALVCMHVVGQLDAMSSDLNQVRSGLQNLTAMNQKLDRLSGMSLSLHQVDQHLTTTNRLLTTADAKLASMSSGSRAAGMSLADMARMLSSMRGDIHIMSRKLSGSFLFRSVK